MYIFYIDVRKHTLRIFVLLEMFYHMKIFHYQNQGFFQCEFFQSRKPFKLQGKYKKWFE